MHRQQTNDPSAQTLLGHVYYFGTGDMAPSFEQAREHFERASKAGIQCTCNYFQPFMIA